MMEYLESCEYVFRIRSIISCGGCGYILIVILVATLAQWRNIRCKHPPPLTETLCLPGIILVIYNETD